MAVNRRSRRADIRPMEIGDLRAILEIERLCFRSPWPRQVFLEELDRERAYLDVLRSRPGAPVRAFVNYWLVHDEVHVLNIATHPRARRRGYGSILLAHVIEFAEHEGCRLITLEVRRSNEQAIRLYTRFGFRPVGIRPNYYSEDREDAIVMLLDLEDDGQA